MVAYSNERRGRHRVAQRLARWRPLSRYFLHLSGGERISAIPSGRRRCVGSFLAARGKASPYTTFLIAWLGNLLGATLMYFVGRRYGSGAFMSRLERWGGAGAEDRLRGLYSRYGLPALFISRFLPGVRAIVPPFAGAMRLPALPVALSIATASGIWFAFVTWVAFRAGSNWDVLYATIVRYGKIAAIAGFCIVAAIIAIYFLRRGKRTA